ncbi:MAG: DsbE family thiol:disulfide interchange protein [Magnetovibrio sp.]|nr:DsbE family thiol:disulfide interchange protein [Magnetovibrio sp.]
MKKLTYFIPLAVLIVLGIFATMQLKQVSDGKSVRELPSVLINREVPSFDLPAIGGQERGWGSKDLVGQVTIVNLFGSWCIACLAEHPFLVHIKSQNLVPIYGIDWREKDLVAGPLWLARHGNPYTLIGADPESIVAISFGVTGAPESFIVDKKGVIRYKQTGVIDAAVWQKTLWPLIQELRKE